MLDEIADKSIDKSICDSKGEDGAEIEMNQLIDSERETVSREVLLRQIEQKIIENQKHAFLEDEDVRGRCRLLENNERLEQKVPPLLRVFLEAFTAEPYLVPRISLHEQTDFDHRAIFRRAIIRIRLFPDTLIANAYGIKFNHSKNTPDGLLEREEYIQHIGMLFLSLVQLQYKSRDGKKKQKSCRMFVVPTKRKKGALVVSRKVKTLNGERRDVLWYNSIYDVSRANKKMLGAYGELNSNIEIQGRDEQSTLRSFRADIRNMIGSLQKWKFATPEEKEQARLLIAELENELSTKINVYKAQAREKLGSAKQIEKGKKVKKRQNPGASCAELVASSNRLKQRTQQIFGITGVLTEDHEIVEKLINELERIFERIGINVDQLLEDEFFRPFDELENPKKCIIENALEINGRIYDKKREKGILSVVKKLDEHNATPAPFSWWASAVNANLEVVRKLNTDMVKYKFDDSQLKECHLMARKFAVRAHITLRYQQLQQNLMVLLDDILQCPQAVESDVVKRKLNTLLTDFNPHSCGKPFAHHDDVKFQVPTFNKISSQMNGLIEIIREWEREKAKIEQSRSVYLKATRKRGADSVRINEFETTKIEIMREFLRKIHDLIKKIDFEEAARVLTPDKSDLI